jgi:hypothetical protein
MCTLEAAEHQSGLEDGPRSRLDLGIEGDLADDHPLPSDEQIRERKHDAVRREPRLELGDEASDLDPR